MAVAAVALGAVVIEKHFTLAREDGRVDSAFSLEPDNMRSLVVETERVWQALGSVHYGPTNSEKTSLRFRRSLYVTRDMRAGGVFDRNNVRAIRPGLGLPPKFYYTVLGRKAKTFVRRGTPVSWGCVPICVEIGFSRYAFSKTAFTFAL